MKMLKFGNILLSISIVFLLLYCYTGVLGTTTVTVKPKIAYVNEGENITFSCEHETDSTFNYTIFWQTDSSETIAEITTAEYITSIKQEFVEYFEASYSLSEDIFNLTLLSANVSLHNRSFECRVATVLDGSTVDSLELIVYYIRPCIITPPVNMTDQEPAEFKCEAEGQPKPSYQWQISSDDSIPNLCDTNDGLYSCSEDGSCLTITKVDYSKHNTTFTCVAANEAGSEECTAIPYDFFYCFIDVIQKKSYVENGLMCSGIEFTLNVQSNPEYYTLDDGITFSSISTTLPYRVSCGWFQTAYLAITCKNLVTKKDLIDFQDNPCWTPIILILVFACVLVVIIILVCCCILCVPKQPTEVIVNEVAATELTVTWIGHRDGCHCHLTFTVEYRVFESGKAWKKAATVDEPPVTLTGLQPLTKHEIRVQCHNMLWKSKMGTVTATTGT